MSFNRRDPNHCPTCDTTDPCVHRETRAAHVAYREGRDAFLIPYANREPVPLGRDVNPYPEDSDLACWWSRGFQDEARGLYGLEYKHERDEARAQAKAAEDRLAIIDPLLEAVRREVWRDRGDILDVMTKVHALLKATEPKPGARDG